jgi:hypothetical protein
MSTLIKNVRGKHLVEFDSGCFDNWCVYLTRLGQPRYAPKDTEYFARLNQLGNTHNHQKIYNDFVTCYTYTGRTIDERILSLITRLSDSYGHDAEEMDVWFSVIYGGMIAEENKANAILKKRIKRLGMHQVLIEKLDAEYAANFSRGKRWRELDTLMKQLGF